MWHGKKYVWSLFPFPDTQLLNSCNLWIGKYFHMLMRLLGAGGSWKAQAWGLVSRGTNQVIRTLPISDTPVSHTTPLGRRNGLNFFITTGRWCNESGLCIEASLKPPKDEFLRASACLGKPYYLKMNRKSLVISIQIYRKKKTDSKNFQLMKILFLPKVIKKNSNQETTTKKKQKKKTCLKYIFKKLPGHIKKLYF